jgi:2-polyprenyl-3-methyl-5-hydroxy-6-metoxy-1,4-benzoquinol methylase
MKTLTTLEELDREIQYVDERMAVSDDEGRKAFANFIFAPERLTPSDPYSEEYQFAQFELYRMVSGRTTYEAAVNEHTPFDLEAMKYRPFPYYTHSTATVSEQLIMQGWMIRHLGIDPPAKLVEFGPGWGNTTLHLAMMGYDVTAVEVGAAFIQLLQHRTAQAHVSVNLVQSDMLKFAPTEKYDLALFFESFHHCSNHLQMLENLNSIVQPHGKIIFAAEPIAEFPFPWGLRLDGISAWSIRKSGWLELGFDTSYFIRTLLRFGWASKRMTFPGINGADVIIAERLGDQLHLPTMYLPPDEDATWFASEGEYRFTKGKSVVSCPLHPKANSIEIVMGNKAPRELEVTVQAGKITKIFRLPKRSDLKPYQMEIAGPIGQISISCATWKPAKVSWFSKDQRDLGVPVQSIRFVNV